jgi:hypothetical protein
MSKFLKLSNIIINKRHIQSIVIKPNKYYINVGGGAFNGSHVSVAGFGFGSISSHYREIEVCKTNNPIDYKMVSNWISNQ